ncbi:TetR/AcrR family transcriptional regulator [Amycolatopsis sp. Poz14]|uniref:TetR/AcrR family transcriptional regulator n=1 Tax=Amycolatopsis sp. Poz14 TaxID=1447705 RepID=UPI001EE810A4|nr:TetR/AcrR family transcriptional regulator [Amycolatopsis sp. Poz14]MCG3751960.1 TetR/AcrR family transcriptional regulator [Amycolatopsis sp. Poz14]
MATPGETGGPGTSKPAPRSKRGERTRNALITAARAVFERDGYLEARIADIAREAGAATGSFYTYFSDKESIFAALVEEVQEEMVHPHLRERTGISDPRLLIDSANREYLNSYRKNARLMALFEQVAHIDPEFRKLRIDRGMAFYQRNAAMIRSLQERGEADPSLDPDVTAHALSAMVGRMANMVFVLGHPIPFDLLVTTLNKIWINALRLE